MSNEPQITTEDGIWVKFNPDTQMVYVKVNPDTAYTAISSLRKEKWFTKRILGICFLTEGIPLLFCGKMLKSYLSTKPKEKQPDISFKDLL